MNIHKYKWALAFTGAAVCVLLLRGCAFTSCLIPSTGMENSIFQGERILVNKWSYGLRWPFMSLFSYHRWREQPVQVQDIVVFNNPAHLQQPIIDQRAIYISRCIGVPGDTLQIDSLFSVTPSESGYNPDKKGLYTYPATQEEQMDSLIQALSLTDDGILLQEDSIHVRSFSRYECYLLEQSRNTPNWIRPLEAINHHELKPLVVPGKGIAITVHPWNITLLRNTLIMHEGRSAEIKNDTLWIEGHPVQEVTFSKDYYWMASNNTLNLSDSRLFGFVPHDHIIGKAFLIWYSKEKGTDCLEGFRWNRFFQRVK